MHIRAQIRSRELSQAFWTACQAWRANSTRIRSPNFLAFGEVKSSSKSMPDIVNTCVVTSHVIYRGHEDMTKCTVSSAIFAIHAPSSCVYVLVFMQKRNLLEGDVDVCFRVNRSENVPQLVAENAGLPCTLLNSRRTCSVTPRRLQLLARSTYFAASKLTTDVDCTRSSALKKEVGHVWLTFGVRERSTGCGAFPNLVTSVCLSGGYGPFVFM